MISTRKLMKALVGGVVTQTLAAAVLLSQLSPGAVKAANAPTKFIEVADLKTSETIYGLCTGKTPQKVYFGKNPNLDTEGNAIPSDGAAVDQAWWIAGYDTTAGGLVLVCDPNQPMSNSQQFHSNQQNDHAYNAAWNCTYQDSSPSDVHPNHYGGSDIRAKLQELETDADRFSTAEQGMMKDTTVWTWDKKNNKYYKIKDKLYLGAAGAYADKYFTVGTNKIDTSKTGNAAVNNGLEVDLTSDTSPEGSPYIIGGNYFWLRSPNSSDCALNVCAGFCVDNDGVRSIHHECVPACALDIQNLSFASAAKPATASSSTLSDGVYLRFTDANKINWEAEATTDGAQINVTSDSGGAAITGDVYLMVQGNDGADDWVSSKKVSADDTVNVGDVVESPTTCTMWLETTVDGVTYASSVEKDVQLTPPARVTKKPTAKTLIYNGQAQELVSVGIASNGTMQYKLVDGSNNVVSDYSDTIPTATDVGTYTVYYKAVGDGGDSAEGSVSVTILEQPLHITLNSLSRVLSGVGGEAGYRYLTAEKPEFYCKPEPGYKLESITIGADGTSYVKFKIM